MTQDPTTAVVLFGHGSRDPLWRKPIEAVAARMRADAPAVPVACAYLELTEPALPPTVASLAAQGARTIRIVPMFLGVGRHAREDLPALVQDLRARHPAIAFDLQPSIGEHPAMLALMARIAAGR
ncbi:sirohydrochlorin chelatase [Xylophilus ampelinus]|uniref:Sirohydrochlorin cobaltochelatase n=1 Tax=Xylophilus ampelinus TaxID=54067 RepID=A0A318SLC3_9BURK|nr:CbiX/SirB N-terminal domain-containing protein [Xylophilus ampelinus]MCS4509060.1 CbiX/SirB N-terminal domain-containing protein [Xylophilus ampelinus]PYE79913.1 sirohydrochlorin cobaltochelatase [Xylophilus ampelinus]